MKGLDVKELDGDEAAAALKLFKRGGRPPTTGRYATREELVAHVKMWDRTMTVAQIARVCRVSTSVVVNILKGRT